jgi:ABC-2 type transport system ATP-binding protein
MKASVKQVAAAGAAVLVSSHLLALVEDLVTHLLILHKGHRLYFGPTADARSAFAATGDASLEDVFLRATESTPAAPVIPKGTF